MMNTIALITDFRQQDGYVGIMKGVIRQINEKADIIDVSHDIPPQDILAASFVLWNAYQYFPAQTIFMCVVDPGVGSDRDIILVKSHKYLFLAPDNGLLDYVMSDLSGGMEIYRVNNTAYFLPEVSSTFHGRDIFSPVAAHLSLGKSPDTLGEQIHPQIPSSPFRKVTHRGNFSGIVIYIDTFGNIITSLELPHGAEGGVRIRKNEIPITSIYSLSPLGELIALRGSHGLLELAVNQGSAAQILKVNYGEPVNIYVNAIQD